MKKEKDNLEIFQERRTSKKRLQQEYMSVLKENRDLRGEVSRLTRITQLDGLTQLNNRSYFDLTIKKEVDESIRTHLPLSLMLIDIDHFGMVNKLYGHPKGDQVLKQVAKKLSQFTRMSEFVARYGGEEFAILMPDSNARDAERLAARIRYHIAKIKLATQVLVSKEKRQFPDQEEYETVSKPITISVGIAVCPDQGTTVKDLLQAADDALREAKQLGRDQVRTAGKLKN